MAMRVPKPLSLRRLTEGERTLAREMFGSEIAPRRIRILTIPAWRRAFVAGPTLMVWPARALPADFSAADVPLSTQSIFVHELTHVWQAQNGINLLVAKLRAGDSPNAYAYDLSYGPAFSELNIEQQAMVVQHAFL
ncbi:MAG TPA: hypothetical protein VIO94_10035, partial [Phenylobacterium sp.]